MRRSIRNIPISVLTILCIVAAVSGSAFVISSGTWQATGTLSSARVGASAALLPDGRILVIGGNSASGPVASADFLNTDGTVSPAPPMVYARASHVSVALQDGRVLVAGGVTAGGSATSTAEIFDPVANSWTSAGVGMTEARSGATAALLQDGRVLIAGGQNGTASSSTIETFDPNTSTFKAAGMMSSPRTEHAMTVLQDGRVLIVGGSNGTAPVASTDIFDPVAGTIGAGPVLSVARFGHSVTTLLNGVVVVIGGNNGNANSQQADVTPTETFDPSAASPAFTTLTAALATPREGHLAILLPNNNSILIVDGTSGGAAVSSPELFSPQESAQGVWTYSFASADLPNPNAYVPAVRSGSAGSANQVNTTSSTMVRNGIVALAGGNDANGNALNTTEAYGYPVVQTDQSDYPPGTAVTITGSGFRPSEAVTIQLVESPLIDTHGPYTVQADANGNISDSSFVTDSLDVNVRFYLTAAGASSGIQAQNSFTDGNATSFSGTVKSSATSTPISGATVTCTSGCTNTPAATTMTASDGAYVFDGKSGDGPKLTFNGQSATITVTASAPGFNSNSISSSISQGGTFPGENIPLTPSAIATTTTVTSSAGPSTYGQSVTFTATIASGMTAPTGSVQFKVDGVNSGTAVGVSPCSPSPDACATLTTSTLSAGSHTIEADFVGTGEFTNSFNTFTQMENTAPLTATVTACQAVRRDDDGGAALFVCVRRLLRGHGDVHGNGRVRQQGRGDAANSEHHKHHSGRSAGRRLQAHGDDRNNECQHHPGLVDGDGDSRCEAVRQHHDRDTALLICVWSVLRGHGDVHGNGRVRQQGRGDAANGEHHEHHAGRRSGWRLQAHGDDRNNECEHHSSLADGDSDSRCEAVRQHHDGGAALLVCVRGLLRGHGDVHGNGCIRQQGRGDAANGEHHKHHAGRRSGRRLQPHDDDGDHKRQHHPGPVDSNGDGGYQAIRRNDDGGAALFVCVGCFLGRHGELHGNGCIRQQGRGDAANGEHHEHHAGRRSGRRLQPHGDDGDHKRQHHPGRAASGGDSRCEAVRQHHDRDTALLVCVWSVLRGRGELHGNGRVRQQGRGDAADGEHHEHHAGWGAGRRLQPDRDDGDHKRQHHPRPVDSNGDGRCQAVRRNHDGGAALLVCVGCFLGRHGELHGNGRVRQQGRGDAADGEHHEHHAGWGAGRRLQPDRDDGDHKRQHHPRPVDSNGDGRCQAVRRNHDGGAALLVCVGCFLGRHGELHGNGRVRQQGRGDAADGEHHEHHAGWGAGRRLQPDRDDGDHKRQHHPRPVDSNGDRRR